jgi:PAS domain S-box-containing protein
MSLRSGWRILALVAVFAALGALGIYLVERVVAGLPLDTATATHLQMLKGWGVVVFMTAALALILCYEARVRATNEHVAAFRDITARQQVEATRARYQLLAEEARDIVLFIRRDGHVLEANQAAIRAYGYSPEEFSRLHIQALRAPETQALTPTQMAQADTEGILFETVHRRKDGTTFPVEVSSRGADLGGERVLLSIVRDITDRKRAEEALATRTGHLEAVQVVIEEITRELDLPRLLRLLIARAASLVGATTGTVYLWDPAARELVPGAWHGLGDWQGTIRLRLGEAIAGTVAETGQTLVVNEYRTSPYAHPFTLQHTGLTASIGEPLRYRETLIGAITLGHEGGRTFTVHDQEVLRLFAGHATIAIQNARLYDSAQQELRQREAAEAALRRYANQLEAVRATTTDIIRELDLDQLLHLITARAASLLDVAHGALHLWDETAECLVTRSIAGDDAWRGTVTFRLGEGVIGTVAQCRSGLIENDYRASPLAVPVFLDRGQTTAVVAAPLLYRERLLGVLAVASHGTRRKFEPHDLDRLHLFADQAAIAIANARLYTASQDALQELRRAQDELVRAEKLRGLGQMAAGIAHELNNILARVLGQAEMLRLQAFQPEMTEGLETLQTAATDGAQVVRRLQDFARQRAGGSLSACDLSQLVPETLEITRPHWREEPRRKGVRIDTAVDLAGLPLIQGNPAEIREVLTNLIFNAVDAMPNGGSLRFAGNVVVEVPGASSADTAEDGPAWQRASGKPPLRWVELAVTDSGIGMTEEVRRRAFDPFFTTKGLRGTGLGLSVVYGIVERHGGQIEVTSAPGQGTTFRLRFRPATLTPPATPPGSASAPGAARRVLVVDDDDAVRQTLVSLLRVSGHEVLEADSGAAAIKWLETTPVDLVLTDLGMPDVNGWDVACAAKARHPSVPVVIVTGWGDQVSVEAPPSFCVDRILTKPVPRGTMLAVIEELTGSH